jgi:DNA-binding response OmpR family regulator
MGMNGQRILIVEDEEPIVEILSQALKRSGYEVSSAMDGDEGLARACAELPDLVLLDLMLPMMDGWEVCRRLKANAATAAIPVIMLTARRDERDAIEGLSIGADDYVRKPFSLNELMARIAARLRPAAAQEEAQQCENLRIDPEHGLVWINGSELILSPTEFRILELLARYPNIPINRERLLNRLWGLEGGDSRTLDTHVSRLRRKLSAFEDAPSIEALRGRGYRLLWKRESLR